MAQNQLQEGRLLNEQGALHEAGYHTRLIHQYDRSHIKANCFRIKEWDYYCIVGKDAVLALTIADNSYMGLDSVTLIDLSMRWEHTKSFIRPLPMGRTRLPATSLVGDVAVQRKGYSLSFQNDGTQRILETEVKNFFDGKPLSARLVLTDPPEDSMVIATPFPGKPKAFYYNQKINCLRASGEVVFDGRTYTFVPEDASAVLDWGRGVWTYRNTWYWSSLSTSLDGVPFGFNLGYGFGDTSAATENMLFYGGKAHKLEHVVFNIPSKADGSDDFLSPWTVADNQQRLNLTFAPLLDRASNMDVGLVGSDQHQVFGLFSGTARMDDGTVLTLTDRLGFAEKVRNKW